MKFLKKLNPIVVGIIILVIGVVVGTLIYPHMSKIQLNCPSCPYLHWGYSGPIRVEWKSYNDGKISDNSVNLTKEGIKNLYIKNGKMYQVGKSTPAFGDSVDNKYQITLG